MVLGPHKGFGKKLGAVILENLGPKSCILPVVAILSFTLILVNEARVWGKLCDTDPVKEKLYGFNE